MSRRASPLTAPLLAAALLGWAVPAGAVQYETDISIETELDLYELQQDELISEETLETLLELLRTGVDLETASREELYVLPNLTYAEVDAIIEYRSQAGGIKDPGEMLAAGVLTPRQLEQIQPFLLLPDEVRSGPLSGRARLVSNYALSDPMAPPALLQVRAKGPMGISAGLVTMGTRRRLGAVRYESARGALVAQSPTTSVQVPKFFVRFKQEQMDVLAGTFRLGFGQRITLDNTSRLTPDGFYADDAFFVKSGLETECNMASEESGESPCTDEERRGYVTPDFVWRDGFRGLVGSLKDFRLAPGVSVSATGFGSYQGRSVYQYELFDRTLCADPRSTTDACRAPTVYTEVAEGGQSLTRFTYRTLPDLLDEVAGGGNVTFKLPGSARLGVTAYGANPLWRTEVQQLDFQEFSRYPEGGGYGAVGLDGAFTVGPLNFFAEAARSFDHIPKGGGGLAWLQRTVLARKKEELELSARYYNAKYANPYGRGIAAPDEYEGLRARNEQGLRLRYLNKALEAVHLRASVDVWQWLQDVRTPGSAGRTNYSLFVRADYVDIKLFQPSIWAQHINKDVAVSNDRTQCFDVVGSDGAEETCQGEAYRVAGRLKLNLLKQLSVALQYQHAMYDSVFYKDQLRQDIRALTDIIWRPLPTVRLRARSRWLMEDILTNTRGEQSLWNTLDATWVATSAFRARARYDLYVYLDERRATATRIPSPENRFRLEVEARF
jgi:hypothetical protein